MATIKEEINAAVDWVDDYINETIQFIAIESVTLLRSNPPIGTPIDTGWASSNWFVSIGRGRARTRPVGHKAKRGGGIAGAAQGNRVLQAGIQRLQTYDYKKNTKVWLINNVPYIGVLNDGWSRQTPAGFVQRNITIAVERSKRAVR